MESDTNYTSLQTGFCCAGTFSNRNADPKDLLHIGPRFPPLIIGDGLPGCTQLLCKRILRKFRPFPQIPYVLSNITHFYHPHIEPTTEMGICHARILLHALHLLQKSPSRLILQIAIEAENQGAFGVVVNAPISNEVISRIKEVVDIPVIATIVSDQMDIRSRIEAGADFLNVSGAAATPQIVRRIRAQFPNIPILATGGPNDETILETIHAGANAITYSPPSNGELFASIMQKYRGKL